MEIAQQRSSEVLSTHVPDGNRCTARDAALVTCLLPGRKTLRSTELPQVKDLQQAVQVATVMEHAPAAYRDL